VNAILKFLITIFFVAVLLWLAFANRESVSVTWSPLHDPASIPVAAIILVAIVAGFIWGSLIVWLNSAPLRRDRRMKAKDINRLEKELNQATQQATTNDQNLLRS
jgi:uncharacterized integral membrane protein